MADVKINIKAETQQFQAAMRQCAAEMKQLSSEYSLAAAQAKLSGSAQDTLRAKVTELSGKVQIQKDVVNKNEDQHKRLTQVLDQQKATHDQLKTKVEAAKKAYEDSAKATGEDSEETKKLKAEYENLQSRLENTEKSIQKTETALTRQEGAVTSSKAKLAELEAQLREVNAELAAAPFDAYAEKAGKIGGTITSVGQAIMPASAAVVGMGTAAVKTAADFDAGMSKVAAISGATGSDLESLREKAREMGSKTKFSATEAASAMEYMAMAGWKTGDMLGGIEGIMNLATASGSDLATTSDIVTDALTAFGMSANDAGRLADVMAAASSNANTNVEMLGESFKYCAPVAGALGYSAEDTAVALGLMANAGIKASNGGTALRTVLTNMSKPTDDMAAAMDELGVSLTDDEGNMKSLREVMEDLRSGFGDLMIPQEEMNARMNDLNAAFEDGSLTEEQYNSEIEKLIELAWGAEGAEKAKYAAMLAGKQGMSGLLAIVNASTEDYEKLTGAVDGSTGAAEKMAAIMQDNLQGQMTILKSQLEELAISFGELLMPKIRDVVGRIQEFVDKLNSMDEGQKQAIIRIGLFVAAAGPLLVALGKTIVFTGQVSSQIGNMVKWYTKAGGASGILASAQTGLSNAFGFLTSPVGIAIGVIAALAAAFIHLWKTNEEFRTTITAIWERVRTAFSEFTGGIQERLAAMGLDFGTVIQTLQALWEGFCGILAPVFEGAFNQLAIVMETVFGVVTAALDIFIGLFTGNWTMAWSGIQGIFSTVWEGMRATVDNVLLMVQGAVTAFFELFGVNWTTMWTNIKTFFEGIWNGISTFFTTIWTTIWTTVTTFATTIWTTVTETFSKIQETVQTVWETITNVIQVAVMFIAELFSAAFELLTVPFRLIWENCKDTITETWETIKSTVSSAIEYLNKNIITPVMNAIKKVIETVWDAIQKVIEKVMDKVKSIVSTAWNDVKTVTTTVWDAIQKVIEKVVDKVKSIVSTAWNAVKTVTTTVWNAIKSAIETVTNAIKTTVTTVFNAVKSAIDTVWNGTKTATTNAWNNIKSTVSSAVNNVKSTVSSVMDSVKTTLSSAWSSMKSTATTGWNAIKSAITTPITAAKDAVARTIEAMRAKFNFRWSLPHLSLPHPYVYGHFSINPPSVPHFGISWYKNGGIMTQPTVFGAAGNKLLAGGEAGDEAILPLKVFYDRLRDILDTKLDSISSGSTVYVYVTMDGEVIASRVYTHVENEFVEKMQRKR